MSCLILGESWITAMYCVNCTNKWDSLFTQKKKRKIDETVFSTFLNLGPFHVEYVDQLDVLIGLVHKLNVCLCCAPKIVFKPQCAGNNLIFICYYFCHYYDLRCKFNIYWGQILIGGDKSNLGSKFSKTKLWSCWITNDHMHWLCCNYIWILTIHAIRLLGWWSIDEGSREEHARLYHEGAIG